MQDGSTCRSISHPLTVLPLLRPSPLATACALLHGRWNVSRENAHAPPSALFSVVDRLLTGSRHASRFVLNKARKYELRASLGAAPVPGGLRTLRGYSDFLATG